MTRARAAAERAARTSYGRLMAILSAGCRDIAAAEDALASAFAAALAAWPAGGVPDNPDAWLLTTARNLVRNVHRAAGVRAAATDEILRRMASWAETPSGFPDERLKLLFVCAHPAIDPGARAPLMLQTVLGLDAATIAGAFLTAPAAMGQRLVRAKTRIREAQLRFEVPEPEALAERLDDVLEAIYAAYGFSWDAVAGAEAQMNALGAEALYLARLTVDLLPQEPEPRGLLALMLYCEARRAARRTPEGAFVPLHRQDARLWSREMIVEAERELTAAARFGRFGRFQCEAAIQSVHVQRPITGKTNVDALRLLYDLLLAHVPSAGVMVS